MPSRQPISKLLGSILLALIFLLGLSACRQESIEVIRINPQTFSAVDETLIGDALFADVTSWRNENIAVLAADEGAFTDAAYAYLRPLLQELVNLDHVTRRDSLHWSIHLVLDTAVHAYTLPGGHLVVHTGLLHALDHEAACVGILAREVAIAESGAAMAAFDRVIEDNVELGNLILGNETQALGELIRLAPTVSYTSDELAAADSLAARIICTSNYLHEALPEAVAGFEALAAYREARPARASWRQTFNSRVSECVGTDSLYVQRYKSILRLAVPR